MVKRLIAVLEEQLSRSANECVETASSVDYAKLLLADYGRYARSNKEVGKIRCSLAQFIPSSTGEPYSIAGDKADVVEAALLQIMKTDTLPYHAVYYYYIGVEDDDGINEVSVLLCL